MLTLHRMLAGTGLAFMLAACGQGSDANQSTATETSMADQATIDPTNPFAAAEMAMNDTMMTAIGVDVYDTWVKQMIEHHRGAIAMSEVVLNLSPTPEVREMARSTITNQGEEVATLTTLIKRGPAVPSSLDPYRPANMVMHEAMMAAKGDNVSETYLRKMLEHHRGAIGLADVVLGKGATGAVRSAALKVKTDQTSEAAMISGMLRRD